MLVPGSWELTVFEKNGNVGGTWFENTYPGVACDTPSSLYTYSWDPKTDWSHYYAYGPEIREYFEGFSEKNDCRKYIKFNTKLIEGRFDEKKGLWSIVVEDQDNMERKSDWCHVLVNAGGILNNWQWPDIEGLHEFSGPKMHSAKWDSSVDYKGKTVGVIGNGSTGIQLVPALQKGVKQMSVFMRSPTWVAPPFGTSALETDIRKGKKVNPGKSQHAFTQEEKDRFNDNPEYYLTFRKRLEAEFNSIIKAYIRGSSLAADVRAAITQEMVTRIGEGTDSDILKELLIPKWAPGCRRISPGDGYIEALLSPNVQPVFGPIKQIVEKGAITEDGKLHQFDILICATGFKPSFRPAFLLYNGKGKSLDEDWGEHVNLYLGVATPRFPNYFTIAGPGSTWSAGSLLPSIEVGVEYSVKAMKKMQQENIRSLEVRQDALDELYEHFDEFHKSTVYQDNCRSWYKDGKFKNRIYLWPGGVSHSTPFRFGSWLIFIIQTIHHIKTLKEPRYEDYIIKYRYGNRFSFLGNGEVKANLTGDVDGLSSYVRSFDHDWNIE
jgi:cation diffusion facilitator CzcD-associated flavoprotein CzcO